MGSGGERVPYGTLVLATGGTPRKLPIDGVELGNVFTLRGVEDAKNIDAGASRTTMHCGEMGRTDERE